MESSLAVHLRRPDTNTKAILEATIGKALMIDEAYTLFQDGDDQEVKGVSIQSQSFTFVEAEITKCKY